MASQWRTLLLLCDTHGEDEGCRHGERGGCGTEEPTQGSAPAPSLAALHPGQLLTAPSRSRRAPTAASSSCCASTRWAAACPAASASCWKGLPTGRATWRWRQAWRGCWPCTPGAWLSTPAASTSCTAGRATAASACCSSPPATASPGCCAKPWSSPSPWPTWPPSPSSTVISSPRRRPSASGRHSPSATRCWSSTCKVRGGRRVVEFWGNPDFGDNPVQAIALQYRPRIVRINQPGCSPLG